jgi:hypothetical protein
MARCHAVLKCFCYEPHSSHELACGTKRKGSLFLSILLCDAPNMANTLGDDHPVRHGSMVLALQFTHDGDCAESTLCSRQTAITCFDSTETGPGTLTVA